MKTDLIRSRHEAELGDYCVLCIERFGVGEHVVVDPERLISGPMHPSCATILVIGREIPKERERNPVMAELDPELLDAWARVRAVHFLYSQVRHQWDYRFEPPDIDHIWREKGWCLRCDGPIFERLRVHHAVTHEDMHVECWNSHIEFNLDRGLSRALRLRKVRTTKWVRA